MVSFSARWEKYLQMLLRKAEEQEKEDRENPENRTKPKPAPEKEAPWTDPILLEKSCCWTKAGKIHHLSQVLDELGFTRRVVLVVFLPMTVVHLGPTHILWQVLLQKNDANTRWFDWEGPGCFHVLILLAIPHPTACQRWWTTTFTKSVGQILRQLDEGSEKRSLENFVETKVPGTGGGWRCSDGRMKMNDCPGVRPSLYLSQKNLEVSGPAGLAKKKVGIRGRWRVGTASFFWCKHLNQMTICSVFGWAISVGSVWLWWEFLWIFWRDSISSLLAKNLILESLNPYQWFTFMPKKYSAWTMVGYLASPFGWKKPQRFHPMATSRRLRPLWWSCRPVWC